MNRIVETIAVGIRENIQNSIRASPGAELRRIFHGPPQELLRSVFERLTANGGIQVERDPGVTITVPVFRLIDAGESQTVSRDQNTSASCDSNYLMTLRNSPGVPRFVALLAPGSHANLSLASAMGEFGVSATANSGTATIDDWIADPYIASLITKVVERLEARHLSGDSCRQLIEKALRAADEADQLDVHRKGAWAVLARVWEIPGDAAKPGDLLSFACGVPPREDGKVDAKSQHGLLDDIAAVFEEYGFKGAIARVAAESASDDQAALDAFGEDLTRRCELPTTFSRSPTAFYGPSEGFGLSAAPDWWKHLTVEKWNDLLQEDRQESGACELECTNSLVQSPHGVNAIVLKEVHLTARLPEPVPAPVTIALSRSTGKSWGAQTWSHQAESSCQQVDDDLPAHKTPIRYSAESNGLKKATLRVIALDSWEPRIFVDARTASKVALPKLVGKSGSGTYETSLQLDGSGRHYLDIYVASGVELSNESACFDAENRKVDDRTASVRRVSENQFGLEVEASGECAYVIDVELPTGEQHQVRVNLSCDEVSPESCSTEFERLIRLNCQPTSRATADVQVERTKRSVDLQSWALEASNAAKSFFPVVVAPDLAANWHRANWENTASLIFSNGRFLSDPRPPIADMQPPAAFVEARVKIAEKIRSKEDHGVIEEARLGEWASDADFVAAVEQYVAAFAQWLDTDPDIAPWCDVVAVTALEHDGQTLALEPDAILLSPLHPLRLGWQVASQRSLWLAHSRRTLCPAASILDPRCVPDILSLPLRTAAGAILKRAYFSVDSSSDYWSVLWNSSRLESMPRWANRSPFDRAFGVEVGGISSGFSVAQVGRALDDVSEILTAKPTLNVLVSSAAGQTNACNDGLLEWGRDRLGTDEDGNYGSGDWARAGARIVQIIDERPAAVRPDDAEIANLTEDTNNSVRWMDGSRAKGVVPDLGIIAQLEATNGAECSSHVRSPVSVGALLRHRVRQQLSAGNGAFLTESRTGGMRPTSGDALLDTLGDAVVRLENLSAGRVGYSFAPSVGAVQDVLSRATFAAVSSSAVDPACFLGGWLKDSYLWDYELPSYSHRAGDSNGYYLLSQVKQVDVETLGTALAKLPGCDNVATAKLEEILREVSSRGIPTVRGMSSGDHGASGDLGLFLAARVIQDEFRDSEVRGLLRITEQVDGRNYVNLALPVDPFRGYLEDLAAALGLPRIRPDLLIASFDVTDAVVTCKLTPVEVKYRGTGVMSDDNRKEALSQSRALTNFFKAIRVRADDPDALIWRLAFQHLLVTVIGFGLRVYSQQTRGEKSKEWAAVHEKIIAAIYSSEFELQFDERGRLIVIDPSKDSKPVDVDGDNFYETMVIRLTDAGALVLDADPDLVAGIKSILGKWDFLPRTATPPAVDVPTTAPGFSAPAATADQVPLRVSAAPQNAPVPSSTVAVPPAANPVEPLTLPSDVGAAPLVPLAGSQQGVSTVSSPTSVPQGVRIHIGNTTGTFQSKARDLNLSDTVLNQLNIGVVGDLGTGKTQLLKSLLYQLSKSAAANRGIKPRILIFDYKKDYASPDFVKAVNAKVVSPFRLPLNIFDTHGSNEPNAWLHRFKFFADTLSKIYPGIGPVQQQKLKNAVKKAYEEAKLVGRQPTLVDVHAHYLEIVGNSPDSPFSIIDDLVDMEVFAAEPPEGASFASFFDGVVVVSLGDLGQDDKTKNMVVALMLNLFYEHMLTIPKRPYEGSPKMRALDSFLLVDEADNIMQYEFDVLRKLLLQGREFGVGVVLASQYLRHFKVGATDYREPLLTWFVHKVPNITALELGALGLTQGIAEMSENVKSLPNHHCLLKTVGIDGEIVQATPFYEIVKKD